MPPLSARLYPSIFTRAATNTTSTASLSLPYTVIARPLASPCCHIHQPSRRTQQPRRIQSRHQSSSAASRPDILHQNHHSTAHDTIPRRGGASGGGPFAPTSSLQKQMPQRPKPPPEEEFQENYLRGSGPGGQKIVRPPATQLLLLSLVHCTPAI